MPIRKVILSAKAYADMNRIAAFYEERLDYPQMDARFRETLSSLVFGLLNDQPGIGKPIGLAARNRRGILIKPAHWVFYSYSDTHLHIRRIFSAKELENWRAIEDTAFL